MLNVLRGIIVCVTFFTLFLFIKYKSLSIDTSENCRYIIDPILEHACAETLKNAIAQSSKDQASLEDITRQFSMITEIIYHRFHQKQSYIQVTASHPWLGLKNDLILLENGAIVQKNMFIPSAWQEINGIQIDDSDTNHSIDVRYNQWLSQTPSTIFKNCLVTLKNPHCIFIKDKQGFVLCDYTTKINDHMLTNYLQVFSDIKEKHKEIKDNAQWIIDMRFNKQIVIYRSKGDNHERWRIF